MIVFMGLKFEEFCKCVRFCLHKALPERTPVANVRNKRAQFRSFYSENLHINAFLEFVVFFSMQFNLELLSSVHKSRHLAKLPDYEPIGHK